MFFESSFLVIVCVFLQKKRQIEKVQRKHKNSITSIDIDLRFENKLMLQSQSPQMNQYMSYHGTVVDYLRKMN